VTSDLEAENERLTETISLCDKELDGHISARVDAEAKLEHSYKTIRALVGEPSESCPSLDCPYEQIVQQIVQRASATPLNLWPQQP
jgi:hypothetical protein